MLTVMDRGHALCLTCCTLQDADVGRCGACGGDVARLDTPEGRADVEAALFQIIESEAKPRQRSSGDGCSFGFLSLLLLVGTIAGTIWGVKSGSPLGWIILFGGPVVWVGLIFLITFSDGGRKKRQTRHVLGATGHPAPPQGPIVEGVVTGGAEGEVVAEAVEFRDPDDGIKVLLRFSRVLRPFVVQLEEGRSARVGAGATHLAKGSLTAESLSPRAAKEALGEALSGSELAALFGDYQARRWSLRVGDRVEIIGELVIESIEQSGYREAGDVTLRVEGTPWLRFTDHPG